MPELPEVEVVRRGAHEHFVGRTIAHATVRNPRAVRRHQGAPLQLSLPGATVTATARRGKYLWLILDDEDALLVHLGMSGQVLVVEPGRTPAVHERARIEFTDSGSALSFVDQRTFGHLLVDRGGAALPAPIAHIARDPFDPAFDLDEVTGRIRRRRTGLKRALLDQSLVSGIGNIYADEALWWARLHPLRSADTLTQAEVRRLHRAVRQVLREGIANRGASFSDYVDARGERGSNQERLAVYRRTDEPCYRCGHAIRRLVVGQRSTHFCPHCQPEPVASGAE